MRTVLAATAVALLGAMAACGGGGDGDAPDGSHTIDELSAVGDCLAPAAADGDSFVQADCGGDVATVEILDMVPAGDTAPLCPIGTDLLVDGRQGAVVDGDIAALVETWCLRNLAAPHPGDPGAGGGELIEGDCFAVAEDDTITEASCAGTPAPAPTTGTTPTTAGRATPPAPQHRLLALVERPEDCPVETSDPIELTSFPPRVLCAGPI
jgi:hypothetical protein